MNEHEVGRRATGQRLKPGKYRSLPRRPARYCRKQTGKTLNCRLIGFSVIRVNNGLNGGYIGMRGKYGQRSPQHRLSGQKAVLLGRAGPRAAAAAGRHDQCGDFHTRSFRTLHESAQVICLAETLGRY